MIASIDAKQGPGTGSSRSAGTCRSPRHPLRGEVPATFGTKAPQGIVVAHCTVQRLMRELHLQGVRRGRFKRTTIPDGYVPPAEFEAAYWSKEGSEEHARLRDPSLR